MIKAPIQNIPSVSVKRKMRALEIRFTCSETELSKRIGELGLNSERLALITTVLEIVLCGFRLAAVRLKEWRNTTC